MDDTARDRTPTPDPTAVLSAGDVVVVSCSLDAPVDLTAPTALLDPEELLCAARFVYEIHRTRFIVAHGFLRQVLGSLCGIPPASLTFGKGSHGKPYLLAAQDDLRFNLSHSAGLCLLATARGREIGIDLEREVPVDVLPVAALCFSAREQAALLAVPERDRLNAFYRVWTRKESFVKAKGAGLSFPLRQFDVSLEAVAGNLLLEDRTHPHRQDAPLDWTVRSLPAADGFCAAITLEGPGRRIVRYSVRSWDDPPPIWRAEADDIALGP